MADALFTVRSAFLIEGRGVCIDTGISVYQPCPICEGQHLRLKTPSGIDATVSVRAVEFLLLATSPPRENYAALLHQTDLTPGDISTSTQAFAVDDALRDTEKQIAWTGDLGDDCTALWAGLMLRAEEMDRGLWWWCVYDQARQGLQIATSNESEAVCPSGVEARRLAEFAARDYLATLMKQSG